MTSREPGDDELKSRSCKARSKGSADGATQARDSSQVTDSARWRDPVQTSSISLVRRAVAAVLLGALALALFQWQVYRNDLHRISTRRARKVDDGGWRLPDRRTILRLGTNRCNIERLWADELSEQVFAKKFLFRRPLILRFRNGSDGWTDANRWTRKKLVQQYGRATVGSGRSESIVRGGGHGTDRSTLAQFVKTLMERRDQYGEPLYVFDRNFVPASDLLDSLSVPPFLQPQVGVQDSFLFLGASMSGVSFHRHADAWNGVVYGLKRWFLYPPEQTPPGGVWPGFSQLDWMERVYPNLTEDKLPLECVQRPGEILYLPESFYHGTLNIGDTVAIGVQYKEARTEWETMTYDILKLEQGSRNEQHEPRDVVKRKAELYQRMLDRTPGNAELHLSLGETLREQGNTADSLHLLEEAVRMDPFFIQAWVNLARMLDEENRTEEAEVALNSALHANPENVDALVEYSAFLWHKKRNEISSIKTIIESLQKVYAKQPNDDTASQIEMAKKQLKHLSETPGTPMPVVQ